MNETGLALHALRMAISDLWVLRMKNATADEVLSEEGMILGSLASLKALTEDILDANNNMQAAE